MGTDDIAEMAKTAFKLDPFFVKSKIAIMAPGVVTSPT
jgi:hypothetical protein